MFALLQEACRLRHQHLRNWRLPWSQWYSPRRVHRQRGRRIGRASSAGLCLARRRTTPCCPRRRLSPSLTPIQTAPPSGPHYAQLRVSVVPSVPSAVFGHERGVDISPNSGSWGSASSSCAFTSPPSRYSPLASYFVSAKALPFRAATPVQADTAAGVPRDMHGTRSSSSLAPLARQAERYVPPQPALTAETVAQSERSVSGTSAREAYGQNERVQRILSWIEVGATKLQRRMEAEGHKDIHTLRSGWQKGLEPFTDDISFLNAIKDAVTACEIQMIDLRFTDMMDGSVTRPTPQADWSLGLCMTTPNRLWQLRTALPLNILAMWPHRDYCRIHIAVCDSADETLAWITSSCYSAIAAGALRV